MQAHEEVPEYLYNLYNVKGKIGEGTYGVVYLASPKDRLQKLLAIKTFKPGKVIADGLHRLRVAFCAANWRIALPQHSNSRVRIDSQ